MRKTTTKRRLIVQVWTTGREFDEYHHATLKIMFAEVCDMKDKVAEATRYTDDSLKAAGEQLQEVYRATGKTTYYHASYDDHVEMRWQSDRQNGRKHWYSPHVEMRHNENTAELYSKVCRILAKAQESSRTYLALFGTSARPQDLMTALKDAGAVAVVHMKSGMGDYMLDTAEGWKADLIPEPTQPQDEPAPVTVTAPEQPETEPATAAA